MKAKIIKGKGEQIRFEHSSPVVIGSTWLNEFGESVTVVGEGLAGMPEVKKEDGSTYLAMPHELKAAKYL